jgi:ATP-dependent Clp protease ATP-binding subunit ClpC
MFQEYIQKSTKKVLNTLEIAVSELVGQKQNLLTPAFVLLALLSQSDSEAMKVIETIAPDPVDFVTQIKAQIQHHYQLSTPSKATQIVGSQELTNLFQVAYEEAKKLGDVMR